MRAETFTGLPCRNCGGTLRYKSNKYCVPCKKATNARDRRKNPSRKHNWYKKNLKHVASYNETYRAENRQHLKELNIVWKKENRKSCTKRENKRRAKKLKAFPKWANEEKIKEFYLNCPNGLHVDHIIPLQNELVCGLHVEINLQYLTKKENISKKNRFEPQFIINHDTDHIL